VDIPLTDYLSVRLRREKEISFVCFDREIKCEIEMGTHFYEYKFRYGKSNFMSFVIYEMIRVAIQEELRWYAGAQQKSAAAVSAELKSGFVLPSIHMDIGDSLIINLSESQHNMFLEIIAAAKKLHVGADGVPSCVPFQEAIKVPPGVELDTKECKQMKVTSIDAYFPLDIKLSNEISVRWDGSGKGIIFLHRGTKVRIDRTNNMKEERMIYKFDNPDLSYIIHEEIRKELDRYLGELNVPASQRKTFLEEVNVSHIEATFSISLRSVDETMFEDSLFYRFGILLDAKMHPHSEATKIAAERKLNAAEVNAYLSAEQRKIHLDLANKARDAAQENLMVAEAEEHKLAMERAKKASAVVLNIVKQMSLIKAKAFDTNEEVKGISLCIANIKTIEAKVNPSRTEQKNLLAILCKCDAIEKEAMDALAVVNDAARKANNIIQSVSVKEKPGLRDMESVRDEARILISMAEMANAKVCKLLSQIQSLTREAQQLEEQAVDAEQRLASKINILTRLSHNEEKLTLNSVFYTREEMLNVIQSLPADKQRAYYVIIVQQPENLLSQFFKHVVASSPLSALQEEASLASGDPILVRIINASGVSKLELEAAIKAEANYLLRKMYEDLLDNRVPAERLTILGKEEDVKSKLFAYIETLCEANKGTSEGRSAMLRILDSILKSEKNSQLAQLFWVKRKWQDPSLKRGTLKKIKALYESLSKHRLDAAGPSSHYSTRSPAVFRATVPVQMAAPSVAAANKLTIN
jgi:hypothetical protein